MDETCHVKRCKVKHLLFACLKCRLCWSGLKFCSWFSIFCVLFRWHGTNIRLWLGLYVALRSDDACRGTDT